MLLHDAFMQTAQRLAGKCALVSGERRLHYGQLHRQVLAFADALREDGVAPGDRVLVLLESSIEYAVAVHAVWVAGGVMVPIHPMAKVDKVAFIAADTRASALLTHSSLAPAWQPALERSPNILACRVAGALDAVRSDARVRAWPADDASGSMRPAQRGEHDLAALIYTSGTTGRPKGVMLSHLNMTSAWASVQEYLGLRETDVIGLALPPAFSYGLYNLLMGLGIGATVVLERAVAFPVKIAETLQRERVTVFPGVPTLFGALLDLSTLAQYDLRSMRLLTCAAAALPDRHLHRLRGVFPQAQLYVMYGLTECKRASYLPPDEIETHPGSVGRGMPNQEHWLVDDEGRRLASGATGELVVRGKHVMQGYWERPAETAERLRIDPSDGATVLYTGDLFRSDGDGYLYFVARKDDIIKTRGEKVAPREVENVIHQLDDVTGCAVVGVADDALGEAVKAFVTVRPGSPLVPRDIIRHCQASLENFMAPKYVEIVETLPRTESGKIRHASLRESANPG